mmetsp:Transcript_25880/g.37091  ORF Transcript_25880/g.37091 Transcript_25880/m.37091 type:complete len:80 (+) Transcript_25880:1083-1322(+)
MNLYPPKKAENNGDKQPSHVNVRLKIMCKKCMDTDLSVQHALLLFFIVIRQIYGYALDVSIKTLGDQSVFHVLLVNLLR